MSQRSVRIPRRLAVLLGSACLTLVAGCDLIQGEAGLIPGTSGSSGSGATATTAPYDGPPWTGSTTTVPTSGDSTASGTGSEICGYQRVDTVNTVPIWCTDTTAGTVPGVPTPPIPVQTTEPCNFPTTVPGGTVPPNLCPGSEDILEDPPADLDPAPQQSSFTCPNEDYPIVQFSTSWSPYTNASAPIAWCGSGGNVESTEGKILLPTTTFGGIDASERIGVELSRMPGGIQSFGTVAIPSQGARDVQLKTRHTAFPLDFDEFEEMCEGLPERTVRGVAGCVNGNDLVWDTGDVFYILTISPNLNADWDDVITWTNTWVAR